MIGAIVNPRSGYVTRYGIQQVRAMFAEVVPDARVTVLESHDDIAVRSRELLSAGATCIAAVGGDGTVSAVAATLIDTDVPLGVIPGGTLNHFARDIGVGQDVPQALQTLAERYTTAVDVGMVNRRVFLNNSSIGLYPQIVNLRDAQPRYLSKLRALLRASVLAIKRTPWTTMHITCDGRTEEVRTRLVFVGNNQYELDPLHLGHRASLRDGYLSCFVLDAPTRMRLFQALFRLAWGGRATDTILRSLQATELTVAPSGKRTVDVSADGEVFPMAVPLKYTICPEALRVVVPRPA